MALVSKPPRTPRNAKHLDKQSPLQTPKVQNLGSKWRLSPALSGACLDAPSLAPICRTHPQDARRLQPAMQQHILSRKHSGKTTRRAHLSPGFLAILGEVALALALEALGAIVVGTVPTTSFPSLSAWALLTCGRNTASHDYANTLQCKQIANPWDW